MGEVEGDIQGRFHVRFHVRAQPGGTIRRQPGQEIHQHPRQHPARDRDQGLSRRHAEALTRGTMGEPRTRDETRIAENTPMTRATAVLLETETQTRDKELSSIVGITSSSTRLHAHHRQEESAA